MSNPSPTTILLALADTDLGTLLEKSTLRPAGLEVTLVAERQAAELLVRASLPDVILVGDKLKDCDGFEFAENLLKLHPQLPIILLSSQASEEMATKALRAGLTDFLVAPVRPHEILTTIERAFQRRKHLEEWIQIEARRSTKAQRRQIENLEALQRVGRSVTASLDLDSVLTTVVDAAVDLTGAEEGSLLLLDEATGELYMRAGRNFQDEFVRTFRLPIRDSLAGQVLRTGQPLTFFDEKNPQKIKTAYLVHTLIYVPLQVHKRVIGVLGVDNRQGGHPFAEDHLAIVNALADYAAVAIENARIYTHTESERNQFETILTGVEDGVLVVAQDGRLVLVNQTVRSAFDLGEENLVGKSVRQIFHHPDILEIFDENRVHPSHSEVNLDDGRVFNAQCTPIPNIGLAITMQDITHLKELDRIKSDFVSTVSHDLRSPLTAILGYVELIERAGPVTDQQREFIHRVQFSVNNITSLINDLLDLGRIEAGFDTRKEIVSLSSVIQYAVEGMRTRNTEKDQEVILDLPPNLPTVLGNPVRLRQVIGNLISNATKFTPNHGKIYLKVHAEGEQVIIQVVDNGPGIPPADQPYIFDRFYRGSNVPYDAPGSGLGLAIVKSIVENHQGRIWLNSTLGQGSTFTVVLPIADQSM